MKTNCPTVGVCVATLRSALAGYPPEVGEVPSKRDPVKARKTPKKRGAYPKSGANLVGRLGLIGLMVRIQKQGWI